MTEVTRQPSAVEKIRAIQEAKREAYRKEFLERDAHREGEVDYLGRDLRHDTPKADGDQFRLVSFHLFRWRWVDRACGVCEEFPEGGSWVQDPVTWVFGAGYLPAPDYWEHSHKLAQDVCGAYNRGEDPTRWKEYDRRRKVFVAVTDDELRQILRWQQDARERR